MGLMVVCTAEKIGVAIYSKKGECAALAMTYSCGYKSGELKNIVNDVFERYHIGKVLVIEDTQAKVNNIKMMAAHEELDRAVEGAASRTGRPAGGVVITKKSARFLEPKIGGNSQLEGAHVAINVTAVGKAITVGRAALGEEYGRARR